MFNVSLPKGSSMFLELCYSLSDISDAFQPSMRQLQIEVQGMTV